MKFLGIFSLASFIFCLLFADIKVNDRPTSNLFIRAIGSIILTGFLDLFIGLPILGIISLFS